MVFSLVAFLKTPVYTDSPLTWGLTLFVLVLLISRLFQGSNRALFLFGASLLLIELATDPFYLFLFVSLGGLLYLGLGAVRNHPWKKHFCTGLTVGLVLLYFGLMHSKGVFIGPQVHDFGIAYTLIRWLSVILEVRAGKDLPDGRPPAGLPEFFCYSFFAPTFFKGPIERFDEFNKTLTHPEPLRIGDTLLQILRIVAGCLKWWLAKHFFEMDWQSFFNTPQLFSYGGLWIGFYSLSVWFYLLVSAANDLTIAACGLAGFRISENYHFPYVKRNLSLFWRSWHMTLTRFCRDFIYIPLGGNRHRTYRNIVIVFLAIALWHVVSKAFVIWGLWQGIGMVLFHRWRKYCTTRPQLHRWAIRFPQLTYLLSLLLTLHFVAVGWLPFWGGHPQGVSLFLRLISGNHWRLFEWSQIP